MKKIKVTTTLLSLYLFLCMSVCFTGVGFSELIYGNKILGLALFVCGLDQTIDVLRHLREAQKQKGS